MADAVAWPCSTLAIADDAGKRSQKRADSRGDVRYGCVKPGRNSKEEANKTAREKGSTSRRWAARKSTPRIDFETAARMKETTKVWRPKLSFLVTFPLEEIGFPSAPDKSGPEVVAEDLCGKTETRRRQEIAA